MKILAMIFLVVGVLFGAVDINTADKKELSSLSGIGAKKADAIIIYRSANCFKSINELSNVKGIGNKTLEKNRENLSVSECK
jgi:competence protein ComEA